MTEIDYLKAKLEDKEKAFDKLYERYIKLLKQQGELERENEQLKKENQRLEKQKNVLINYMDNWCPKRFYDGIIKRMEEVE